jgi:hypothetical protein
VDVECCRYEKCLIVPLITMVGLMFSHLINFCKMSGIFHLGKDYSSIVTVYTVCPLTKSPLTCKAGLKLPEAPDEMDTNTGKDNR